MKTEVILKDVIQITDKDILNAMAYTLYEMSYKQVEKSNQKEYSDFLKEFMEEVELNSKGITTVISYSIAGFDLATKSKIEMLCHKFNNFTYSRYITDKFLVIETFDKHFKLGLLNSHDKDGFQRVGKLNEILDFLNDLLLPYEWEYEKFFRLGCNFGS